MKNIQVIDRAINCTYSICAIADEDFAVIFPADGQDIEFVEDLVERIGEKAAGKIVMRATARALEIDKRLVKGIHGTFFFGLAEKRKWYPNKRETDLYDRDLARAIVSGRPLPPKKMKKRVKST